MAKKQSTEFTQADACLICEAHEIYALLENEEEIELLYQNNPELLAAYRRLYELSNQGI
jgi:hypothetical protein